MFKQGDYVQLIDNDMLGAPLGSLAVVVKVRIGSIDVMWFRNEKHQQMDGGYRANRFVLYQREKQMEDTRSYLEAVTM